MTPPDGASVSSLLTFANQFVGKVPYVSGGNTPSGWDCSGFVQYVYGQMGVSLPHYSGAQATVGRAVGSLADAQPGDIIANAQHAAIYVGNGHGHQLPAERHPLRSHRMGVPQQLQHSSNLLKL